MSERNKEAETKVKFKLLEKCLSRMIERGDPATIAVDDPENPKMRLKLDSARSWSIEIGEMNLKIGVDPSVRHLLHNYALTKDPGYIDLAGRECSEAICQKEMSLYLLVNESRVLGNLVSDMESALKILKDNKKPALIRILKSLL